MQVHFGTELLHPEWTASVGCIGTFDGVHLGHQMVIRTAVAQAREKELPSVLVTFDRHPAAILAPEKCPAAIASVAANLRAFEKLGVAISLVLPFTNELSQTSAFDFTAHVLEEKLRTESLVVGHDFAFGRGREGTPQWLEGRMPTTVIPPFELEGHRVSSSAIRQAVAEGRPEDAAVWLGRPFSAEGVVVPGQRLGRTLGYPTINLGRSFNQVTPGHGVYAGIAHTDRGVFRAAIGIGVRPTVGGGPRTIEAYLLDYSGESLYGTTVNLDLVKKLRAEEDFPSLEALKRQMASDVEAVRSVIAL